jgi:hypothetical protein
MSFNRKVAIMRLMYVSWTRWLLLTLFSSILFINANGCMLLAAGAAGAGAGYIAGQADDDDVHVVHEREVIVDD